MIIDRFTKTAHFIPIRISSSLDRLARLYISKIVSKHGMPTFIISNRDPKVHITILDKVIRYLGNTAEVQYSLPSSDR